MKEPKTCFMSCIDPRLTLFNLTHISELGTHCVAPIILANPVLTLAYPKFSRDQELLLESIMIIAEHHGVERFEMFDHFDCGLRKKRGMEDSVIAMTNTLYAAERVLTAAKIEFKNIKKYILVLDAGKWVRQEVNSL